MQSKAVQKLDRKETMAQISVDGVTVSKKAGNFPSWESIQLEAGANDLYVWTVNCKFSSRLYQYSIENRSRHESLRVV
jgi:hypothetical protein